MVDHRIQMLGLLFRFCFINFLFIRNIIHHICLLSTLFANSIQYFLIISAWLLNIVLCIILLVGSRRKFCDKVNLLLHSFRFTLRRWVFRIIFSLSIFFYFCNLHIKLLWWLILFDYRFHYLLLVCVHILIIISLTIFIFFILILAFLFIFIFLLLNVCGRVRVLLTALGALLVIGLDRLFH